MHQQLTGMSCNTQAQVRAEEFAAKVKELELADQKLREEQMARGTLRKSDHNVSIPGMRQPPPPKRTASVSDDKKLDDWAWDPSAGEAKDYK